MKTSMIIYCFALLVGTMLASPRLPKMKSGMLCSACQVVFKEIKTVGPKLDKTVEPKVEEYIKQTCDQYTGSIPMVDQVCQTIMDEALDKVVEEICTLENDINPLSVCKKIDMCH